MRRCKSTAVTGISPTMASRKSCETCASIMTLNRPAALNALTWEMALAIERAGIRLGAILNTVLQAP